MTLTLDFLPQTAFAFFLMFARIGALTMALPGVSSLSVPNRVRLVFALALTLVMYPLIFQELPTLPTSLPGVFEAFLREMILGAAIGLCVRLITASLEVAASIISFQTGLASALTFDPNIGGQASIFATFFTVLSVVLIFSLDLHHLLLAAMYDSYKLFPIGGDFPTGDFAQLALRILSDAFRIALQLTAPFLIFGLIFYLGVGILARLIPQVQIFFVSMPATIFLGFILLLWLLGSIMTAYMQYLEQAMTPFLAN